ncbi:RND superfamily putative drug exporter [Arthrobacter woluwensis]|uniref:MMPL family transporter n=1 Tax=Arthrobacter woluwensis TaxID=156980 RepID=UPI00277F1F59|nr:MMPL family transporter [Arthrobacter woluwensis]MDQ0709543.1 RND superfamily putative drug exporter [Arthrobacter woluwensis]
MQRTQEQPLREGVAPPSPSATRTPARWIRILLPALLIVGWLVAGSVGGPYFGKVDEVSSNDQTTYLPSSAEATQVQQLLPAFNEPDRIPAIVLFTADSALTQDQTTRISAALQDLKGPQGVAGDISPAIPSEDGKAVQAFVSIDSTSEVGAVVEELRQDLRQNTPSGVSVQVTGPAGFTADLLEGFSGIDGLLLAVSLIAVLIILVVVYRSFLLPLAVLLSSVFALCVALLTVWWLAKAGVLLLNGQTQGILFILVIGAATDYSLLYVSRYRDELARGHERWAASRTALRRSLEPIAASGGTVIAGLLCLLLSDLKSNSALGPVAAIGIVFAMLSALTFLPALLYVMGRAAFWPRRPRAVDDDADPASAPTRRTVWDRLAVAIRRRPRLIWSSTVVLLVAACFGLGGLQASGVPQSDLVLGASEARDGQKALGEHFPGGSGSPALLVVPADRWTDAAAIASREPGVQSVSVSSKDAPGGSIPWTPPGEKPAGTAQGGASQGGAPQAAKATPTEADGRVLLQATLRDAPDSQAAEDTVVALRNAVGREVPGSLVGGVTATALDTNTASVHDRNLIIPVVLGVIFVILGLLLRSIVAPLLLILSTVLSFGAALGVSALVFNHVLHFPGADASVPLYGFVFLVALGIDYNIFLMSRVREEMKKHGSREGLLRGLKATGGVITSAGLVLAATFAALGVIPILFLAQIAFIVAFGVLLDTFVVRSLLVPAVSYELGRWIWWPSRWSRKR